MTTPEQHKDNGNKHFGNQNYTEAIEEYTQAIDKSKDAPNHVYYANRANVYMTLHRNEECIADCDQAIKIDASYSKSYFRKAKALQD